MPWIEPDYEDTTLEGLRPVERYWHRYDPCHPIPFCQRQCTTLRTPYGVRVHPTEPMGYDTSHIFLKMLGKDAGFDMSIATTHFGGGRRTRLIVKHSSAHSQESFLTDRLVHQARSPIKNEIAFSGTPGPGSSRILHDHLIHRDVQSVVLLCPPQSELCHVVAQMSRKRDPNAPNGLTEEQYQLLSRDPYLTGLCQKHSSARDVLWRQVGTERSWLRDSSASQ